MHLAAALSAMLLLWGSSMQWQQQILEHAACQGMQEALLQLLLIGLGSCQRLTAAGAQPSLCRSRSVCHLCASHCFAYFDAQTRHSSTLATPHLPRQLPWDPTAVAPLPGAGMLMAASRTGVPALRRCSASQLGRSWAAQKPFCTMQSLAGREAAFWVQLQGRSVQQRLARAFQCQWASTWLVACVQLGTPVDGAAVRRVGRWGAWCPCCSHGHLRQELSARAA